MVSKSHWLDLWHSFQPLLEHAYQTPATLKLVKRSSRLVIHRQLGVPFCEVGVGGRWGAAGQEMVGEKVEQATSPR